MSRISYVVGCEISGVCLSRLLKLLIFIGMFGALGACTCATPVVVSEIQRSDKKLTCKDVILEINESEHFKDLASKERGIGLGNALMPVCWVSSYVDTSKAINAANARIAYLGNIYDVLDCGGKSDIPNTGMRAPQSNRRMAAPSQQYPSLQNSIVPDEPMVPGESDDAMIRKDMHKHVDKHGKTYSHSHYHAGPHRHSGDK